MREGGPGQAELPFADIPADALPILDKIQKRLDDVMRKAVKEEFADFVDLLRPHRQQHRLRRRRPGHRRPAATLPARTPQHQGPLVRPPHLVPALPKDGVDAATVGRVLEPFSGRHMAKSVLETTVLDAQLRSAGESFASHLGASRDRVPCGVSVGIMDSIPELLDAVEGYVAEGYVRIKLKIEPGWDVEPVRAVRERFGDDLLLQVDANAAYAPVDVQQLAELDDFVLLLIEQSLANDDMVQHAQLAELLRTPICLDESIESAADAAAAITLGACSVINIKPARVGGYLEARRIHDIARAHGAPVW